MSLPHNRPGRSVLGSTQAALVVLALVAAGCSGSSPSDSAPADTSGTVDTVPSAETDVAAGTDDAETSTDTEDAATPDDTGDAPVVSATESLGYTDIELRDASQTLIADFNTPAAIADRLNEERSVSWSQNTTSPANLTRFSFGSSNSSDVFVLVDAGGTIEPSLTVSSDLATATTATNDLLLRSIFQFVEVDTGKYAVYSTKHGNYALDVDSDGTSLVLRDVRSLDAYNAGADTSLLTFSASASPLTMVANGRYQLNSAASAAGNTLSFDAMTWTDQNLVLDGGSLQLDSAASTQMSLYEAPIQLNIPSDFNPDGTARVSNAEYFDISAAEGDSDKITLDIAPAYADQVTAAGSDPDTLAAAQMMLDNIDVTLAEQGSQTRYPQSFYLSFREGLFKRTIQSSESVDGTLGEPTVPYVYFTNEVGADGIAHPFMVVSTRGVPDALAILGDVARPPGDGLTGRYEEQNVTRSFYLENFLLKFPMRDYGEVATPTENDLSSIGSLADDVNESNYDHHNYASTGSSALAIDGVVIYPSYNNTLNYAQSAGELSVQGMHSGRGLGVHYHADGHHAATTNPETDTGLSLYDEDDYAGTSHPPIIGLGFDGVAAYGFYLDGDTESHGASIALDEFGGHEHDDYGYHYHAASSSQTSGNSDYTLQELGPLGAWAGRVNDVPEFEERINRSIWLGNS